MPLPYETLVRTMCFSLLLSNTHKLLHFDRIPEPSGSYSAADRQQHIRDGDQDHVSALLVLSRPRYSTRQTKYDSICSKTAY